MNLKPIARYACLLLLLLFSAVEVLGQGYVTPPQSRGDELLDEYFTNEAETLSKACLADVSSLEAWTESRETYRQQLAEMLGLHPMPERTPLQPTITRTLENDEFIVECLHFQSMPGLYVTANLYRPKQQTEPLPAILYGCGHAQVVRDGVSLGNKTQYQYHGEWFARNGYVCLTVDTIQLGEISGFHHGTYRMGRWWWNNRGYTPAGVEAWNCIRALDYLQSRPEVDGERIGMTGRSGGGVYTWWTAALDERVKVAVPVAGITNLKNHVIDGCVEGHCDCMYMVNKYRWDYAQVAALVAPRPLLISNTDKDRIFPLDGVVDLHSRVRKIYDLYDAGDKLGLQITEGPHKDTQELRIHSFRWFNRFLKNDDSLITTQATSYYEPQQLRVFNEIPKDERVTTIDETFVAKASDSVPANLDDLRPKAKAWQEQLLDSTFRGWPDRESQPLDAKKIAQSNVDKMSVNSFEFTSQSPFRLRAYLISEQKQTPKSLGVVVVDQALWESISPMLESSDATKEAIDGALEQTKRMLAQHDVDALALVAPRGVGLSRWNQDEKENVHIRRRFMLLGQTVASMQVYDVIRGVEATRSLFGAEDTPIVLSATGDAAYWSLYASLFIEGIRELHFTALPTEQQSAPDMLNVSKVHSLAQALLMASDRVDTVSLTDAPGSIEAWRSRLEAAPWAFEKVELQSTE